MRYLSLFSGIGGFELGIQQAYEDYKNREQEPIGEGSVGRSIQRQGDIPNDRSGGRKSEPQEGHRLEQWLCIGYSEIDKYAIQIYEKHFNHKNYGDITKVVANELPDFDFLCGGFPCQSFSIAGKRRGFEDTRGTLFFDIARILSVKKPRLFLLENVKGLLSHDNGKTFSTIIKTLDELGYDIQWQVLNSKNFGVSQNRERVFIIGHLRGTSRPEVFPFGETDRATDERLEQRDTKSEVASTVRSRYDNGTGSHVVPTLRATDYKRGDNQTVVAEKLMMRDGRDNRSCLRAGRTPELGVKGMSIRRLTPTECERLQSFPDGWTEGVSDTQRYKTLGNAVTVNVIKHLIPLIIKS